MKAGPSNSGALTFGVGDITVRLMSVDPRLQMEVQGAAGLFLVTGAEADIHVEAAWGQLSDTPPGKNLFDSGGVWQLYRRDADYIFQFKSPTCGAIPYKQACFNSSFTSGELRLHVDYFDRSQPVYPLEFPLDELLLVNLLANGRGVEVHACGLVDSDGRGHLFLGHSGGGKSTMARLWQEAGGVQVLSDDRIILRSVGQRIWMYGTPWHGEARLASPARVPVAQIFFLRHALQNGIVSLRPAEAVARLMACSFVPFYSPGGLDFTVAFFQQMTQSIPVRELSFAPDERVVEYVRQQAR